MLTNPLLRRMIASLATALLYAVPLQTRATQLADVYNIRSSSLADSPVLRSVALEGQLQTPQLVSPANGVGFDIYPRRTTLVWQPVANADYYTVDVQYNDPVHNDWGAWLTRQVRESTLTFDFVGAQPGRWRVTAASNYPGAWQSSPPSEWWYFSYSK
jgi:hypothetical protein